MTMVYLGGAARGHLGHGVRPVYFPLTTLTLASPVSVSGDVYSPMGWLQYSRLLWLSRANHNILYPNAMTAQMRVWWLAFPQRRRCQCIFIDLAVTFRSSDSA
jgi:hypothetical protein